MSHDYDYYYDYESLPEYVRYIPEFFVDFRDSLEEAVIVKDNAKKIIDNFFKEYEKEIVRWWLKFKKFCLIEDEYGMELCDDESMTRELVDIVLRPLLDFIEMIRKEIKYRLHNLFLIYKPKCSNCRYFIPYNDPRIKNYVGRRLPFDKGYCVKCNKVVPDNDLCGSYEPMEDVKIYP